ncbi:MAG: hypothetical protein H2174_03845 [Vampirovibrio sp.]|nr:hypothetical protein [Vampirovibrio sp.]
MISKKFKLQRTISKKKGTPLIKKFHQDFEKRLEWAEKQSLKYIEDLNKANDYIIERAYKYLGILNFFSLIVLKTFNNVPVWVSICFVLAFIVSVVSLIGLFKTNSTESIGFSLGNNINTIEKREARETYINLDPECYLLHKDNNTEAIYGWIIPQLKKREESSASLNKKLAKTYNQAVAITSWIIGLTLILWIIHSLVKNWNLIVLLTNGWRT